MIKAIDAKYCKGDLVQLMTIDGGTSFIASPEEIILLKGYRKVYVNKYENHPNRYEFPYSENVKTGEYFNELYEYNKPYIIYESNHIGYICSMMYFFKGSNRAIKYETSLPIDLRSTQDIEEELTREEIESKFNKDNYDSMYIIDVNVNSFFINNNLENICLGNGFDFSDEEIIARDLRKRERDQRMANIFRVDGKKSTEEIKARPIEEIKDLKLYSGFINKYSHLLLTSKDGVFSLMWFNIVFVEKDKFRLTYSIVPIKVPTVDNIISYCEDNDIEYTSDPELRLRGYGDGSKESEKEFGAPAKEEIANDVSVKPQGETPKKGKSRGRIPSWM